MRNISRRIQINVDKINHSNIYTFKQNDDGVLRLALYKGQTAFDITGQTIKLGVKRSDKTLVELSDTGCFSVNNNELDIAFKNSMLAVNGVAECDLELSDSTGKMTTASFFIKIDKKVLNDKAVEATNEFDTFTKTVEKIEEDYNSLKGGLLAEDKVVYFQNEINKTNAQLDNITTKSINEFGVINDANYYNQSNGKYYKDSELTIEATDNTLAIKNALNSGYNIQFENYVYYVKSEIILNKPLIISGKDTIIYSPSRDVSSYLFYVKGNGTTLKNINFQSYQDKLKNGTLHSNIICICVECDNFEITNCNIKNFNMGISSNTMITTNNTYIKNCNIISCDIPIFGFYCNNMYISNCVTSCTATGITTGDHALYFSDNANGVYIENSTFNIETYMNGAIIQCYSARTPTSPNIKNIKINNCTFNCKCSHALVVGHTENLDITNCVFNILNKDNGRVNKILYSHGTNINVKFNKCRFDIAYPNAIILGSNSEVFKFNDCNINFYDTDVTNIFENSSTSIIPCEFYSTNFKFNNGIGGQVFGGSGLNAKFYKCYFDCGTQTRIAFTDTQAFTLYLIECVFENNKVGYNGNFFIGTNTANGSYDIRVAGCKFYGWSALHETVDNTIRNTSNLFLPQI